MNSARVNTLFHSLQDGGLAITATRRLARQLQQRYAAWRGAAGARVWPAPRIQVLDDWLAGIWQAQFDQRPDLPCLLGADQELLLWEQALRRHEKPSDAATLLALSATARAARDSWTRVHAWQLDWAALEAQRNRDSGVFLDWCAAVQEMLRERNWLTRAQLPGYLLAHAERWLPVRGQAALWLGFDHLPPATTALMERLDAAGFKQRCLPQASPRAHGVGLLACRDSTQQWQHVARWARAELNANPAAALGVVCPDLERQRDAIEAVFEDVLHPRLAWQVDAPRVYHLSLGRALSDYPVITAALDLLRCTARRVPFDTVSRLLRSPYLGAADELARRSEFESRLRARGGESLGMAELARQAGAQPGLADLTALLERAAGVDRQRGGDAAGWAAFCGDWLRACQWPGEAPLNSHDYQAVQAWRELLSNFASLNTVQGQWTLDQARQRLVAMAGARTLQFHDEQAPLQVMGVAESAGLWFDHLWLADMGDSAWPPPARPDPFIPVRLQKAAGIPQASAPGMREQARLRSDALLASAATVTVSFAPPDAAGAAAVSPLFQDWPEATPGVEAVYPGRIRQLVGQRPVLQSIDDARAPVLATGARRGGAGLLADQAQCPFRAFAHHRLAARDPQALSAGLDARERGSLVHEALRLLWRRLGDQDTLRAADGTRRAELAAACAAAALAAQAADSTFRAQLLELEGERLAGLLLEWLELEAQRAWFRVAQTEVLLEIELAGMRFELRADRIDELADGACLVIDYKTGQLASTGDWVDPRMAEPQLPLYALAVAGPLAGVAWAGVRRGACQLRGVVAEGEGGAGTALRQVGELGFSDLAVLRAWWRRTLEALADDFRRGVARVDPVSEQACRYCDVMPLCRVFERDGAGR